MITETVCFRPSGKVKQLFLVSYAGSHHETIEKFSPQQNDRMYKKLTTIVSDHNAVIDVCQKMSRCLSPNVLIHYFTSAVITCICCLMILLAEGAAKIIFVNYIIASTTQVFVYSISGNMLEDASTGIYFIAYDFPWYKCDQRIRKTIQMIMIRSQRKTAIDVPFFDVSLETFSAVSMGMRLHIEWVDGF